MDEDGAGTIDTWTSWQTVSELYDYTPGFIRVVSKTPAMIDLLSLPSGYGFQFEFRIDDTVVSGVKLLDSTVLEDGDKLMEFSIQAPNGEKDLFWRILVF